MKALTKLNESSPPLEMQYEEYCITTDAGKYVTQMNTTAKLTYFSKFQAAVASDSKSD